MTELSGTTIWINRARIRKLDRIIEILGARTLSIKPSRSEVAGRAIDDLFLLVCPSERTDDTEEKKAA